MKTKGNKQRATPLRVRRKTGFILGERDARFIIERDAAWTALVNTEADAYLYAAAPELLEELEKMLCAVPGTALWKRQANARRVIAKAKRFA